MSIINSLQWRYAVKRMTGQKVEQEKVNVVLEAARQAASSIGLQPFSVIVVKNEELRKQIAPLAYNQPQITECSHLLIFAAWTDMSEAQVEEYIQQIAVERGVPREALQGFKDTAWGAVAGKTPEQRFEWFARQAYISFGTAIAAAAYEKIDSCPMEGFNGPALDTLLGLDKKNLRSVTLLALGHRDEVNDKLAGAAKVRRAKEKFIIEL
ncbi:Nitroreductase [Chitinophaga costaii]|uniref:Nitroreductase n=1 Tax=Chitinophaga costaii TaxID=1335309 RepID=A0A1C4FCP3_9BACT|nr:nitroreductase family protein [Chitinophaga costaii]PUZ20685.1 NAD(P)H-dependent oxidoreductase [Chitinophaga costaii]SCC53646.1 Nitroreductase [Chitinophaga costaii]